ncbi:MAG: hypothetical protein IPL10_07130 [Bacteroidetes bacterium]|nr:hypothetical protein [Bacteroidota bacterium]
MKNIILFLLLTLNVKAQKDSTRTVLSIFYGQKYLSHKTFEGKLNDVYKMKFGAPISYIGIGESGSIPINRSKLKRFGHIMYTQIIPQDVKVSDTITVKISGFNFALTYFGFDVFPNNKHVDFFISSGFNTGRLRFFGNSFLNQKNPYFSPKISITPRILFGDFCFQMNIDYEVDVSKKNWRRTNFSNSDKINLPQTSNTGLNVLFGIGIVIKDGKNKKETVEE